ncbi:MAG: ZIP family metal transporter [Halobacteriales archaeon]
MALAAEISLVFVAGFITALATGLGALPFFVWDDISQRANVVLWGFASGVMVAASVFGLVDEGLSEGGPFEIAVGAVVGVGLVVVARDVIIDAEIDPREYEEATFKKLVLILGVLTVHSFPEGIAVGVSFADLGLEGGVEFLWFTVPLLAVFMTLAISIHNVPEGTAISIPLRAMGVSKWRMVWWAVFSSLPQPVGAVIAYAFVAYAREVLPYGFGFAAGAMVYLVLTEFVPEALDEGKSLPGRGRRELALGVSLGVLLMVPLAYV